MIGLNHAGTGIVIALTIRRPELAVPFAFISHFVLDMIPHSLVAPKRKYMVPYLVLEGVGATVLTLICMIVFPELWLLIGICAVAAYLPDFMWPFYYKTKLATAPFFRQFFAFHKKIQWSESYRGWVVDILYFSVIIIFLSTYKL